MASQKGAKMRRQRGWLFLAVFSVGFFLGNGHRWSRLVGVAAFLVSFLGLLISSLRAGTSSESPPADIHEAVVLETCAQLTPLEAAALVGVLQEYRIVPVDREVDWVEALAENAAIALVARATKLPPEQLEKLYREHWVELRTTMGPVMCCRLQGHRLIERIFHVSEFD